MVRFALILTLSMLLLAGCETDPEKSYCYPQRVTRTIPEGAETSQVTADYKYEDNRLDHIIWSNFQTHYFSYLEDGSLGSVSRKNVQTFRTLQSVMVYDEGRVSRTNQYSITLDRFTQENVDTSFTGYHLFTHEDGQIVLEEVFDNNEESAGAELVAYNMYTYDAVGNITRAVSLTGHGGDTLSASSFTYDNKKHPFNGLELPFEGESYINNVHERTDMLNGDVYFNQIIYTTSDYPEQLNIKQESYLTEVIRIDYLCD